MEGPVSWAAFVHVPKTSLADTANMMNRKGKEAVLNFQEGWLEVWEWDMGKVTNLFICHPVVAHSSMENGYRKLAGCVDVAMVLCSACLNLYQIVVRNFIFWNSSSD